MAMTVCQWVYLPMWKTHWWIWSVSVWSMSILGWLKTIIVQNKHEIPVNDEELTRAHNQAYNQGNVQGMSSKSIGSAAALQASPAFFSPMTSSYSLAYRSLSSSHLEDPLVVDLRNNLLTAQYLRGWSCLEYLDLSVWHTLSTFETWRQTQQEYG